MIYNKSNLCEVDGRKFPHCNQICDRGRSIVVLNLVRGTYRSERYAFFCGTGPANCHSHYLFQHAYISFALLSRRCHVVDENVVQHLLFDIPFGFRCDFLNWIIFNFVNLLILLLLPWHTKLLPIRYKVPLRYSNRSYTHKNVQIIATHDKIPTITDLPYISSSLGLGTRSLAHLW